MFEQNEGFIFNQVVIVWSLQPVGQNCNYWDNLDWWGWVASWLCWGKKVPFWCF